MRLNSLSYRNLSGKNKALQKKLRKAISIGNPFSGKIRTIRLQKILTSPPEIAKENDVNYLQSTTPSQMSA